MKITYIHQYFRTPLESGGTRSFEMARRMTAAGHSVQMIGAIPSETKGSDWVREQTEGIDVHRIPVSYNNRMSYTERLRAFSRFSIAATGLARRLPADVVFATSTPLTVAIPGILAARRQRAPFVFEVRDLWPDLPIAMGTLTFPPARVLARQLELWAYRNAAEVVALSPGMAAGVEKTGYPAHRIHCIPNSSDIALFDVDASRGAAFRAERPWLGERKLVIYAGTLGKINGVSHLVEVAARMRVLDPEVRFLIVGGGAEEEVIRARASNAGVLNINLFMEARLAKARMPDMFSAATICSSLFIDLPEMWHNSANKFFDGLAAGRPLAINYGGWQAELLNRTGAGLVLSPTDAQANALALHRLMADPEALAEAGHAAAKLARDEFSRDQLAERLIAVLEKAAGDVDHPSRAS